MSYYFAKTVETGFDNAVSRARDALREEGFGVISDIDVGQILRSKLGVEFRPYVILGACDPVLAHGALTLEDKIGTLLPCNVIVQEFAPGLCEVAAVDPVAAMRATENTALLEIAKAVASRLQAAINAV